MASLRARLLAAVLVLAAMALLLMGAVTYAEQRSFLLDQVDARARAAPPAMAKALADAGVGPSLIHTVRGVGYTLRAPRP